MKQILFLLLIAVVTVQSCTTTKTSFKRPTRQDYIAIGQKPPAKYKSFGSKVGGWPQYSGYFYIPSVGTGFIYTR